MIYIGPDASRAIGISPLHLYNVCRLRYEERVQENACVWFAWFKIERVIFDLHSMHGLLRLKGEQKETCETPLSLSVMMQCCHLVATITVSTG